MGGLRLRVLALLTAVVVLGVAAPAYAGSGSNGYGGNGGNVEGLVASGGQGGQAGQGVNAAEGTSGAAASGLPFTGLDLGLMLGGGVLLIGTGAALSRILARRTPA